MYFHFLCVIFRLFRWFAILAATSWCTGTWFVNQGWGCWLSHLCGVWEIALSRSRRQIRGWHSIVSVSWISHQASLNLTCTWGSLVLLEAQNHGGLTPREARAVSERPSTGARHYTPHGSWRQWALATGTHIRYQTQLKTGCPTDVARAALSDQWATVLVKRDGTSSSGLVTNLDDENFGLGFRFSSSW